MAGTPGPRISQHPAVLDQQQQQDYMQQFNNAAYAPIPGVRGQQPIPPMPADAIDGQPSGYSPNGAALSVQQMMGRGLLGNVTSEWMNQNMTPEQWQTLLPQQQGPPAGMVQNHMVRPTPMVGMSGPYGRQAMQMAGLLGRPGEGYPTGGGLLSGPKRAFRVPGGK